MNEVQVKKQAFLKEAAYFFKNASFHADEGDLQSCAGLILKALYKERMARGVGPQVLHLIKTRQLFNPFLKYYSLFKTEIVFAIP